MKSAIFSVAALVALVAAAPGHGHPDKCTPGTYSCTTNPATGCPGWQTCNTSGQWEFSGDCPPDTVCKFFPPSGSPYCVGPDVTIQG